MRSARSTDHRPGVGLIKFRRAGLTDNRPDGCALRPLAKPVHDTSPWLAPMTKELGVCVFDAV